MELLEKEWFLRLVIGAFFAAAGFFGKDIYENRKRIRESDAALLVGIHELRSLIDESSSLFFNQINQAIRLKEMLRENHGDAVPSGVGYDEIFFQMYDKFEQSEAEMQKLIRSTTMHSLHRVNNAMRAWIAEAQVLRKQDQPNPERKRLAQELSALELHLNQWNDKYEAFIPGNSKRSLIFLADEKDHGIKFPPELCDAVDEVIATWR